MSKTNISPDWAGLLQLILILAKIFGVQPVASWSWWWVMSPMIVGVIVAAVVFGIVWVMAR